MTSPKRYGIYTARFPFLEAHKDKIRPVVVVSAPYGEYNIIAIVPISSRPKQEVVDTNLADWQTEGLLKSSVARVHRLTTMLQADLQAELGELTKKDVVALQRAIQSFLEL